MLGVAINCRGGDLSVGEDISGEESLHLLRLCAKK